MTVTEDTAAGPTLGIGDLARPPGVPVRTIRFYCDEGILESRRSGEDTAGSTLLWSSDSASSGGCEGWG